MKKVTFFLFAIAMSFAMEVSAIPAVSIMVGEKGVFHIRGFADDSTKALVFVKTNLETFGEITPETKIKVGEEEKTAADLRELEGKSVLAYGKRVNGIFCSLTVVQLSEAERKPGQRPKISYPFLKMGCLDIDSPRIGGQVILYEVGSDYRMTKRIKDNLYLGKITDETMIYINEQSAGPEELWRLRGSPDLLGVFYVTEEDIRKESEPENATIQTRIVKEIRILIFE